MATGRMGWMAAIGAAVLVTAAGCGSGSAAPDGDTGTIDGDSEGGQLPEPWVPPTETWSTCPEHPPAGGLSLARKAAYYDWIVPRIHQTPAGTPGYDGSRVYLADCDGPVPETIVADDELPFCTHRLTENNGLWTSLYVASQAFRLAATGDPDARRQLLHTLRGTRQMLSITGKPGLYARDFRNPAVPQHYCIEQEAPWSGAATDNERYARYVPPDRNMVGNSFVRIDTDGCFLTWDPALNDGRGGWARDADHCTDSRFAGFCWQRNASKDEYAGHMFAAGIVARIIDDPEARAIAVDILGQVARHLVAHDFWINDYDGRNTRYGSAHALSLDEMPGSNAIMALAWIKMASEATGDAGLAAVYEECLLQLSGERECIDQPFETPRDYREYLDRMGLALGCGSNYDTISIAELNYFNLIWYERDPTLRATYRAAFRAATRGPDIDGRDLWAEADPFRNMILAGMMETDDGYDPVEARTLIADAVCSLKRFPTDNILRARDNNDEPHWCQSDRHGSLAAQPIPVGERCASVFEWWGDPNEREVCGENLRAAEQPAGFLLPYWMGRYFGFVNPEL